MWHFGLGDVGGWVQCALDALTKWQQLQPQSNTTRLRTKDWAVRHLDFVSEHCGSLYTSDIGKRPKMTPAAGRLSGEVVMA